MASADSSHPATLNLERFMRGELERDKIREIVRHMLTGCPDCVAVTRRLWNLAERSLYGLAARPGAEAGEGGVEGSSRKVKAF
jgi:hypothetical protein